MVSAISTAKITPPRLPQIVERPRLLERLEQNRRKKLTLILGQAAQGKSTLAASYIRQSSIPTAWVNLQKQDSDPVNLFFSMAHALHHALKGMNLLPLLNYPAVSLGPRLEKPMYREWITAIFDSVSGPVQMVMDGLNNLAPDAPSFGFIKIVLDELPRAFHLIMLSRHAPPMNIEGMTVKQEAHVLTNSDLALTPKEIKAFFKDMKGMAFTPDQLKRIHAFTEGWVRGLILLSETLDRLPEEDRDTYVSQDLPGQFRAEVFQYFGDEILAAQPEAVQRFLIKSSIFDTIDPEFMKAMGELGDAEAVLRESTRKNLFVDARHEKEKEWVFHYHPLFRDFLKAKFRSDVDKQERRRLYLKAGTWHEKTGELEASVGYYLRARAFDRAASVVEQIGMPLLNMGKRAVVSQWLRLFPQNLVWENPWLLLYQSLTRRYTHVEENIHTLKRCLDLFERDQHIRGQLLAMAALVETLMLRGRDPISLADLVERGEALVNTKASSAYPSEKAMVLFQMAFALTIRSKDQRKAVRACQEACLLAQAQQDLVLELNALMYAVLALERGSPQAAACATRLLSTSLAPVAAPELESLSHHPEARLRKQATDIQRTIHRSQLPRIHIETLGGFRVYRGTNLLPENEWQRAQPRTLLKSLITHGSRDIDSDRVIADIWSGSTSAEKKFKVALHRLRKALEPGMKKAFGSSYIHLKGGKLYLDHERVDLDVDRFVTLIHKGKHHEREGRMTQALTCYQEAIDLYRGDFLPEDRHTSWVENKRNELKNQFLDLLLSTARIHETRGSFRKATALYKKALQTDPLLEEACQRVMRLLSEQGKRSEALRVYEQFKTALHRELSARPDPVTDSIHRKIMA